MLSLIFLSYSFASFGQLNQRITDKILNKSKKNIQDSIILVKKSIDFINNYSLSDEEKDRIPNRIRAEFKNTIFDTEVPMGEKACK